MVLAVVQRGLYAHHRIAGQHAVHHGLAQALFDGGDVLLRHHAADDRVDKLEVHALVRRLKPHLHDAELAAAAGLFLVLAFRLRARADRLAVRDTRVGQHRLDVGLVLQLAAHHVDVHLAQALDKHIARFGILFDEDGRVFLADAVQAGNDLVVLALLLGGHRQADARRGELDRGKADRFGGVAQRVAGRGILQLAQRADVARIELVERNGLLAAHEIRRARLFRLLSVGIVGRQIGVQGAGVHLDDGVFAELVDDRLDDLGRKRAVRLQLHFGAGLDVHGLLRLDLIGGGQIVHHVVEQRRHADVGRGGHAAHRRHDALAHADGEAAQDVLARELALFKILFHELLVALGGSLGQLFIQRLRLRGEIAGDVDLLFALAVKQLARHMHDIDIALERAALDDGQLNGHDGRAELLVDGGHDLFKVRVLAVELVDDHHAGLALLLAHGHGLFRTDNGAGNRANDDQRTVRKLHRRRHFAVKVEKARRIDHVDFGPLPFQRRQRQVDGDVPFDLLGIKVGGRGAVLDLAQALQQAGVEQHSFRQRGLALTAMAEYADVADVLCGIHFHSGTP